MRILNQLGHSLLEVLVVLGLGILLLSLVATETVRYQTFLSHAGSLGDLQYLSQELERTIVNPEICNCQLSASTNLAAASRLVVNSTISTKQRINLGEWRKDCNFGSPNSLVVKAGEKYGSNSNSLKIESVFIDDILSVAPGSELYRGNLTVGFVSSAVTSTRLPVHAAFYFKIDMAKGIPAGRPIKGCARIANSGPVDTCPHGWAMYGSPGLTGAFCMEKNLRNPLNYQQAANACASVSIPNASVAVVCSSSQLLLACLDPKDTSVGTASEMTANSLLTGSVTGMNSDCRTGFLAPAARFRCCLK